MAFSAANTREALIVECVSLIMAAEGRDALQLDRVYLLDLVSEVATAVDGRRSAKLPKGSSAVPARPKAVKRGERISDKLAR